MQLGGALIAHRGVAATCRRKRPSVKQELSATYSRRYKRTARFLHTSCQLWNQKSQENNDDIYELLGIPRNADKGEIKRAYYRLAKIYHPDTGEMKSDPNAEKMFSKITLAYDILNDDEKRKLYDEYGWSAVTEDAQQQAQDEHNKHVGWGAFAEEDPMSAIRLGHGESIDVDVNLTFEEAFAGRLYEKSISRDSSCDGCGGKGTQVPFAKPRTCDSCGGKGFKTVGAGAMQAPRTCSTCKGTGAVIEDSCKKCHGSGVTRKYESVQIPIPAGVYTGVHVRLANGGNAGLRGQPAGHLWAHVFVKPHPVFRQDKSDVHLDVPISLTLATTGGKVKIPIPPGEVVDVQLPAGVQSGETRVLKGKGAPVLGSRTNERGNLYMKFHVRIPAILDPALKMALENLDMTSPNKDATWHDYMKGLEVSDKGDAKQKNKTKKQ